MTARPGIASDWFAIANAESIASPALLLYPERIEQNLHMALPGIDDIHIQSGQALDARIGSANIRLDAHQLCQVVLRHQLVQKSENHLSASGQAISVNTLDTMRNGKQNHAVHRITDCA